MALCDRVPSPCKLLKLLWLLGCLQVNGIMVNEYTGDDVTTRVHEEQWLHQMLTINDPKAAEKSSSAAATAKLTGRSQTAGSNSSSNSRKDSRSTAEKQQQQQRSGK